MSIDDEQSFKELIKLTGTIEHLQVGLRRVNLLSERSGLRAQNVIGLADDIGGDIGREAMAASSANHEIAELEYFAFYIGDDLVQGVCTNVTFKEGDEVDVVVQRTGEKNHVRAICKKTEKLIWIPLMMEKSIGATFFRSIKHVLWMMLMGYAAWSVFALLGAFQGGDLEGKLFMWSIPAAGSLIMGLWDFAASWSTGLQSTKVFRMLGLPNAFWIDLAPYSLLNLDNDPYGEGVYRYGAPSGQ